MKRIALFCALAAMLAACQKVENPSSSEFSVAIIAIGGGTAKATVGGMEVTSAEAGATVTLTATASAGYTFAGWTTSSAGVTLADPTARTTTFIMPRGDVAIEAVFEDAGYAITLSAGSGGTSTAAVDDTETTAAPAGTIVTLTATANEGYGFVKWTTATAGVTFSDHTAPVTTFTMPESNIAIVAEFKRLDPQIYDKGVVIGGLKWATRNVGAAGKFVTKPETYGGYFTFEEALTACPDGWRVPTKYDWPKLHEVGNLWTTVNGVAGQRFGSDDNTVFLPAGGYRSVDGMTIVNGGEYGWDWTSSPMESMPGFSYNIYFTATDVVSSNYYGNERHGHSVRCVAG